jgi:MarR family transcriptional regulator, organic hydroperoxide resistance regulator
MNDKNREQLGNEIAGLLGPLVRSLSAAFRDCAGDLGLALSDAQALWLLAVADALTTKELAGKLGIDPANASTLVTRLERRGLVRRGPAADDRRKRLVSLTPDGSELRLRLAGCVGERRPAFRELTTDELVVFRDLLRRIAR